MYAYAWNEPKQPIKRPFSFVDHTQGDRSHMSYHGRNPSLKIAARNVHDAPLSLPLCGFVARDFRRHFDFGSSMKRAFTDCLKAKNAVVAAREIDAANARLTEHGYSYAMPDEDICRMASEKSHDFLCDLARLQNDDIEVRFARIEKLLGNLGVAFPKEVVKAKRKSGELHSLVARGCDEVWLRRQLRRKCAFQVEQVARDLALVQRSKQPYCSDFSVKRQRQAKKRNRDLLENMVVFNKENPDQFFDLSDLHDHSIANPELRRGEMFVRLRGFEEIAKEQGHCALFLTVTAPSRFHAISQGKVNKQWIDSGRPTAKNTHNYLMGVWKAFRKDIDKAGVKVYGMRIVEPHQDGTPHNHFLLFCETSHRNVVINALAHHALKDSPDEKGAKKHRFTCETIDFKRGSAVGYVAKYLSKSIDGQHLDKDKGTDLSGIETAERVVSFARVNGIRQFQFIGGAPVSVWRQMRRLREEFKEDDALFTDLDQTEHFLLESIRRAADDGDWKAFTYAMGGVFVRRGDESVKLAYDAPSALMKLHESGELSTTKYGDMANARIMGLMFKQVFLATRFAEFEIENKEKYLRGRKRVMTGVVDIFDALEREKEYERMNEEAYQKYLARVEFNDQLNAMVLMGCSDEELASYVSRAAADIGG